MRLSSHEGGGAWPGGVGGLPPGPLGGASSMFGDGSYSGNVIQGGSVVQPQMGYFPTTNNGQSSSYSASGGYMWIDGVRALTAGDVITHLGYYDTNAGVSVSLHIVQDNGSGNFTTRKRLDIVTAGGGWAYYPLATPYTIPASGTFRQGVFSAGNLAYGPNGTSYWGLSNLAEGASGTAASGSNVICATGYKKQVVPINASCVVVTGAATVAPDADTGASVVMCDTLIIDGGSLKPSTNSKGLIVFAKTQVRLLNGATCHINFLGKAGNFGNLTAYSLAPASIKGKLRRLSLESYVVLGTGATYGAGYTGGGQTGRTGGAASAMQTGGGGSGGIHGPSGIIPRGGIGGPCCGGAASGGFWTDGAGTTSVQGGDFGGPGGDGGGNACGGGGAGDPVGLSVYMGVYPVGTPGQGAGGGLLMLFSPSLSISSGCIVSADGAGGGSSSGYAGGGGGGGGLVAVVTAPGGYTNAGTVRAAGGIGGATSGQGKGGDGGAGSVNIFTF